VETVLVSEELNKQQVAASRGQATENTLSTTQSKHNLSSLHWLGDCNKIKNISVEIAGIYEKNCSNLTQQDAP
jgi:hypothetical protein